MKAATVEHFAASAVSSSVVEHFSPDWSPDVVTADEPTSPASGTHLSEDAGQVTDIADTSGASALPPGAESKVTWNPISRVKGNRDCRGEYEAWRAKTVAERLAVMAVLLSLRRWQLKLADDDVDDYRVLTPLEGQECMERLQTAWWNSPEQERRRQEHGVTWDRMNSKHRKGNKQGRPRAMLNDAFGWARDGPGSSVMWWV